MNKDSIAKAGNKQHPLPFPDPQHDKEYIVYRVPIEILSFNFDNARIASELRSIQERSKRKFSSSTKQDQKDVGNILLNSKHYTKGATNDLKNSLSFEQKKPAYVTFDAVVIDGNRRMACLNALHDDTGEQRFTEINICVLPKASPKELIFFENNLQIATDFKQEYGRVNDALRLRDMKNTGFSYKEIESSIHERWDESDIKKRIEEIDLVDKYLSDMGKRNQYDLIEKKGMQSFSDLLGALAQSVGFPASSPKAKVERQKRRLIGFGLITNPDTSYQHIRKYKSVLKDPKASKEFIANSPIHKSGKTSALKDKKVLDEELENLEWSHDFLTKKKAAAIVLLKAAYKKLDQVPLDRIPKNNKDFNSYFNKIVKIIDKLQKKL